MQVREKWAEKQFFSRFSVAVDAVDCELFSARNSLLTGKNTGNFSLAIEASSGK
jgi:hypothetical protein